MLRVVTLRLSLVLVYLSFFLALQHTLSAQRNAPLGSNLSATTNAKYAPDRILVKFRSTVRASARLAVQASLGTHALRQFSAVRSLELVGLPSGLSVQETVQAFRQRPEVEYAEPDYIVHAFAIPNDPMLPQMWNLLNTGQNGGTSGADIGATSAWDLSTGSRNVVVAILDTGIDYDHPDLGANLFHDASVCNGVNDGANGCYGIAPANNNSDPLDDNGHGTHVAGIIGAVGNNGIGVVGVNWNVQLLACKFLNVSGSGQTSDAIACLDYVLAMKNKGYNIVATNNSWGGGPYSQALADAIQAQQQAGILFITAAGNDFSDDDVNPTYPSATDLPNVISVAASTRTDSLAAFSNFGRHTVHLGAPGQEILSTLPGNTYGALSGTSMATPQVTGTAALLAAENPNLDWRAIKNLILAGGDPLSSMAQTITGNRLNVHGSMTCSGKTVRTRLQPVNNAIATSAGAPVTLEVLNIACAQPNGSLQVTVSPGGQILTLADDGSGADKAAGDGVYTTQWIPPQVGSYTLTFPGDDVVTAAALSNYVVAPAPYNYVSITGTNLNLGDDSVAPVTSPFSISFGGGSFTQLEVGSNGTISLTDAYSAFNNQTIPASTPVPVTLVAPFWTDLYPVTGSAQNVYWAVTGTAPNRELVVEWRNVRSFQCRSDSAATVTFEVVFSESSGDISFEYQDAAFGGQCFGENYGSTATVGVQVAPTMGTMWSAYQQTVGDGTALLWTIETSPPPNNPVPVLTSLSPTVTRGGPAFTLTAIGSNFVPQSQVQWNGLDRPTTYINNTRLTAQIAAQDISAFGLSSAYVDVVNPPPGGGSSQSLLYQYNNQVPTITAISPNSTTAGSFSFSLTITGMGFAAGESAVYWNGSLLQGASVLSDTEITVGVLYSLIANPGTAQVTVVNAAPGGGTSNAAIFTILSTAQAPLYFAQTSFLNGHPKPADLGAPQPPVRFMGWKYAARGGANYLKTFLRPRAQAPLPLPNPVLSSPLGNSLGALSLSSGIPPPLAGLQLRPLLPADFIPTSVATGDFNGDGIPDWVVSNGGSNNLWVYLGSGDGTFSQVNVIPLAGRSPIAVTVADLRGIGRSDVVVAEADSASIGVLLSSGDGTFADERTYFVPGAPISLAVADCNHDGHLDIVAGIIPDPESGPLVTLPGDGSGGFGQPIFEPNAYDPQVPESIVAADFEKNGYPDVILVDRKYGAIAYGNDGTGRFKRSQPVFYGFPGGLGPNLEPITVAQGDLNEDGCLDVLVLDDFGMARVFFGNCDGTFQGQSTQVGIGDTGWAVAMADMNGDGHLDLVYSGVSAEALGNGQDSGSLTGILFGDGKGNFRNSQVYRGGQTSFGLAIADLNRDGHPDIVTANQDSDSVTLLLNDGQGGFGFPQGEYIGYINGNSSTGPVNSPFSSFTPADVNGDGKPDLVVVQFGAGTPNPYLASVMLNDGTGKFGLPVLSPVAEGTLGLSDYVLGDFRNSGQLDLLAVGSSFDSNAPTLSFAANAGGGKFSSPRAIIPTDPPGILAVGDFNQDGKLDFVSARTLNNPTNAMRLVVYLGHGDGTFTPQAPIDFDTKSPGHWPEGLWAGDFNHDGKLDLLVWLYVNTVPYQNNDVYELPGNGNGTFAAARIVIPNLSGFAVVDVNHDNLPDVVESRDPQASSFEISPPQYRIFLGQSDGSFVLANTYAPYVGNAKLPPLNEGTPLGGRYPPWIGDFNGDGNIDIAAIQEDTSFLPSRKYVQFLLGNGDGTFTPTYDVFYFNSSLPTTAFDLNNDGKTDLVELDGYTSSFHVIPAQTGPTLRLQMVSDPVIGAQGAVRVSLAIPAASGTQITLSASNPAITIPASVTIPEGSLTQDVSFQIASGFNASHVFWIQASLNGSVVVAYGTQAMPGGQYGVVLSSSGLPQAVQPGQTTGDYGLAVESLAGYSATLTLSCQGLPAGASCQFGTNPLVVPQGGDAASSVFVSTSTGTPLGEYTFTIVATDGAVTATIKAALDVGDYSASISPASVVALPNTVATYTLNVSTVDNYSANFTATCSGVPAPAVCNLAGLVSPSKPFNILTNSLGAGNYNFTVSVTNGFTTRSASAQLKVEDFNATFSSTAETISVGQSANVTINLTGLNGFVDPVTLACAGAPAGVSCSITPSTVTPSVSGTAATLAIAVNARPKAAGSMQHTMPARTRLSGKLAAFGLGFIAALALAVGSRNRRRNFGVLALVVATCLWGSCGGGTSGGGEGGGGGGGGGVSPVTFNLSVQGTADGITKGLGVVQVTVP
jgi:hypothetical protein